MMAFGRYTVIALLAGLVAGCGQSKEVQRILDSPIVVDTQLEAEADFSKYQTWSWLPLPSNVELDPRLDNPEFTQNVDNAVEREMFTRGYQRSEQSPDLLVNGHAALEDIDQNFIDEHYNGSYYPEYRVEMSESGQKSKQRWQEGTIILFIFDAKTRQLVYRASAQAEVTDKTSPKQRQERVDKAINLMMASFPRRK